MIIVPAIEALQRLRNGNNRFVHNELEHDDIADAQERSKLVAGQDPFAIILGCSDSRVPVELIFDQGLGDLFVIRVAGNIVAPSGIGSVEFAATEFGVQLVVVMGHSNCGAVGATIDALNEPDSTHSKNIAAIVNRVRPAVEPLLGNATDDRAALVSRAVTNNVLQSVAQLESGSPLIKSLVKEGRLAVVGACYSLESGQVDFFDSSLTDT
jgi:carbonic anhydrase